MNFREKLVKNRQEKLLRYGKKASIEDIFEHVLEHFNLKTHAQFLKRTYIIFEVSERNLFIKEMKGKTLEAFYQEICDNKEDACNLLISLEAQFLNEEFKTIPEFGTAQITGCFCVEIDMFNP